MARRRSTWGASRIVEGPAGTLPLARLFWRDIARRETSARPGPATLTVQTYEGTWKLAWIRQVKRDPVVYVELPAGPGEEVGDWRLELGRTGRTYEAVLWKGGKRVSSFALPPYPRHRVLLARGRLLVATTQGDVVLHDPGGEVVWRRADLPR